MTEVAAERLRQRGGLLADVIIDSMRQTENPGIRLQGARLAMELEHREAEVQLREDRSFEDKSNSELLEYLADTLARIEATGAGHIRPQPTDIVVPAGELGVGGS
jgi:hypothetical protein